MIDQSIPDELPSSYTMKVCPTLLTMGFAQGIRPDDMVEFFAIQVQAMLMVPPNYKMFGNAAPAWIMRGFYPESSLFFKLTIVRNDKGTWVKATIPDVKLGLKKTIKSLLRIDGAELNKLINDRMENAFFNANHELKSLVPVPIKLPRCMSPKGVKIFSYDKAKNPDTNVSTSKGKF